MSISAACSVTLPEAYTPVNTIICQTDIEVTLTCFLVSLIHWTGRGFSDVDTTGGVMFSSVSLEDLSPHGKSNPEIHLMN